jgi:hypothetical protein
MVASLSLGVCVFNYQLIEIVSPANKDRPEHVEELALKTATALERGIHVLVVDLFPAGPHDPQGIDQEIRRRLLRRLIKLLGEECPGSGETSWPGSIGHEVTPPKL